MIVAGVGGLFLASGPASADVKSVAGSAYGAKVATSLGINVGPLPAGVSGSASDSGGPTTYDTGLQSSVPVNVPGVVNIGVANARSQGNAVAAVRHLGFAASATDVANVSVGPGSINLPVITATCSSDGTGSVGTATVAGATLGGNPLLTTPLAPNGAPIIVPGIATIALDEQIRNDIPGVSTSISVNAVHITLLPAIAGLPPLADIILGHVDCAAAGPDVLVTPPTSSTTAPATTTTTTGAATTTTTVAPTTTTTVAGTTTTTTAAATTTTTVAAATTTTTAAATTTTTLVTAVLTVPTTPPLTVSGTVLARTGATLQPLAMLSGVSIVLGILLLIGTGRPLTATTAANGSGTVYGGTITDGGPERWGPVEIAKTIGAGVVALVMAAAKLFGPRKHKRE